MIASNKGSKKSNDNTRKLRKLACVESRSRISSRQLSQGMQREQQLDRRGRRIRLVWLLIEPDGRQLVGLKNDSNTFNKMPKELRGDALRYLRRQA